MRSHQPVPSTHPSSPHLRPTCLIQPSPPLHLILLPHHHSLTPLPHLLNSTPHLGQIPLTPWSLGLIPTTPNLAISPTAHPMAPTQGTNRDLLSFCPNLCHHCSQASRVAQSHGRRVQSLNQSWRRVRSQKREGEPECVQRRGCKLEPETTVGIGRPSSLHCRLLFLGSTIAPEAPLFSPHHSAATLSLHR